MQVAGIRQAGARVEMIDVGEPRPLAGDEVLLEVMAAGVGNWDEYVRAGGCGNPCSRGTRGGAGVAGRSVAGRGRRRRRDRADVPHPQGDRLAHDGFDSRNR